MTATDILTCDTEPIRTPGAIQPHGALLLLSDDDDLIVEAISENCAEFIGIAPAIALGQPCRKLLGDAAMVAFNAARQDAHAWQFSCESNVTPLDCQCYASGDGRLCLDMERCANDATASRGMFHDARQGLTALRTLKDVDAIAQATAGLVRSLTGFDRVMVYRFDADWNGEVVAESRADLVEPYLGLHFPASDIPHQARELYLGNKVRQIPDIDYQPVALVPTAGASAIDLGRSALRSVSPIHIEYMKNMGVRATLVGSLVVGGRLWGLIACHQMLEAKYLPRFEREVFAWICEDISSQLAAAHSQQLLDEKRSRATQRQRLLAALYENGFAGLLSGEMQADLLSIVNADGFALVTDAGIETTGKSPQVARINAIQARRLEMAAADPGLFHTHALAADLGLEACADGVAGALCLSLDHRPNVTMIWFREEREHAVVWGGDPASPHEIDAQRKISPRRSFAAFRQVIHGHSLPWSAEEVDAAEQLGAFIEIDVQRDYKSRLDASESIYRSVVNAMAEGVVVHGASGEIITCNPRAEQILGLGADQMKGRTSFDPRWSALHEDGQEFHGHDHPSLTTLRTGKPCLNVIMGVHKADGSLTWISINTEPLIQAGDTRPHGVVATFLDITERKRAQSEDLAARIIATQEQERARLSHDLHDEVGQTLTALKISLARAQQGCTSAVLRGCFDQSQLITERLMADVRSLAHQLRPQELDALGLAAALRSHLDKVIRPLGQTVTLNENIGEQRLPPEIELCCFRVIQESLTNCMRHSRATRVDVSLGLADKELSLSVRDDGIGFVVGPIFSGTTNHHSIGLIGMRERVAAIGGQMRIKSGPGLGTEIIVSCTCEGMHT